METISSSYQRKCQCCLSEIALDSFLEISESIEQKFFEFTSLNLMTSERLSSKICSRCNDVIAKCLTFKENFIENQRKLQKFLAEIELAQHDIFVKQELDDAEEPYFIGNDFIKSLMEMKTEGGARDAEMLEEYDQEEAHWKNPKKFNLMSQRRNKRKCSECDFESFNSRGLERHRCEKHKTEEALTNVEELEVEPSRRWKYPVRPDRKSNRRPGARTYVYRNSFKCSECDFECVIKRSLVRHLLEQHKNSAEQTETAEAFQAVELPAAAPPPRLYKYPRRMKKCQRKAGARKYTYKNSYKCNDCEFETVVKRSLDRHKFESHHSGPEPPRQFVLICEFCSKEFKDSNGFQRHIDKHNNVKRFFCDICGFGTHARQDLRSHVITHLKDDPRVTFRCDFEGCQNVYRYPASLRKHKEHFHLKLRPYSCTTCSKSFATKVKLTDHIKFVHQKLRPFMCDVQACGLSFAYKSHVTRHKRLIHQIVEEAPKKENYKRNKV